VERVVGDEFGRCPRLLPEDVGCSSMTANTDSTALPGWSRSHSQSGIVVPDPDRELALDCERRERVRVEQASVGQLGQRGGR
jgi:hypothetical protein